ncbi:MAG: DUF1838 family protein, partial [Chromatocurvus sp.]
SGLFAAFAQGSNAPLDLDKDSDLLRAYVKMRCSLGSEMAMGWLRGKRFAFSEGRVEPLCGMLAATFSKINQVAEDEFEFVVLEVSIYTDFETGELLETVKMPFTGRTIDVPVHRFGPTRLRFAVSLDESEHYEPAPGTNQGEFAGAGSVAMSKSIALDDVGEDSLVLRHEEYGRRYPDGSDIPSMFYRESTLWSAPLQEVMDPARNSVASEVSYSAMTSWRPWMQMGDIPGHTASNGFGRRAFTVDELPADYRRLLGKVHPDVLDDPESLLKSLA